MGKLEARNKTNTPIIGVQLDKSTRGSSPAWVSFHAPYEVSFKNVKAKSLIDDGKWLDDVEVNWELMYKPAKAGNKIQNYLKMTKKVKYTSVGEGKHTAVIFIHPTMLSRYFLEGKSEFMRGLILKFSMKINGKTIKNSVKYFEGGREVRALKVPKLFTSEDAYDLKNILLNRNETPFA